MSEQRPVVLITGAGTGIGRSTAETLAKHGWRVVLNGRRTEPLEQTGRSVGAEGTDWSVLAGDVGDPTFTAGAIDSAVAVFGRLDAVVNNAGWSPLAPLGDLSPDQIAQIFAVNATGPTILAAAAARQFSGQDGGVIVNVSSVAAADPFPGLGAYGAAKAAMNTLAKAIATEHGESGVRAWTVAPGAVETPLLRSLFSTDQLPVSATLDPSDIASVIAACILGERDEPSGSTITVASPT